MAKKKQSKKHKFKYLEPTNQLRPAEMVTVPGGSGDELGIKMIRPPSLQLSRSLAQRDFSYVMVDLKRVLVLGCSLVFAELLLWYLFGHTGLGSAVYKLVKV